MSEIEKEQLAAAMFEARLKVTLLLKYSFDDSVVMAANEVFERTGISYAGYIGPLIEEHAIDPNVELLELLG